MPINGLEVRTCCCCRPIKHQQRKTSSLSRSVHMPVCPWMMDRSYVVVVILYRGHGDADLSGLSLGGGGAGGQRSEVGGQVT